MKRARALVFCALCVGSVCASLMYAAGPLVADDIQSLVRDERPLTRAAIQLGAGDPIVLDGVAVFDVFGNVVCGSLLANSTLLLYDTTAMHSFTLVPTYQKNASYPQATFLSNGFVLGFRNQSYTAAQIASGAAVPIIKTNNVVYHKGTNSVAGFVGFNGGFTILPDASLSLNTLMTVTGPLDLRETGTLILAGNLNLVSRLTVSCGGGIDGQGKKLILAGNLTLPSNKIIHLMSDTVIDGNGYTLTMGDYGQLFIDNNMTLTLQNITLVSGAKTAILPPIQCAGSSSNLVLDNVTFSPGADIPFYQGQLFIYDTVHFTGTSALVYTSPQSSFIMPDASLYFDTGTTFSFAPSTASKDQIVMSNATSSLVLNGCTLKVTDTGLQLTRGTLTYQGSTTIDTKNGLSLSSITTVTSGLYCYAGTYATWSMSSVWRPDRHSFAVAGYGGGAARVYSFNGDVAIQIDNAFYPPVHCYCCAWSPDGRYLAVTGYAASGNNQIYVYSFNGTALTLVASTYFYVNDAAEWAGIASWSPDGKYLAVGGYVNTTYTIQLYSFNGVSIRSLVSYENGLGQIIALAWHPSGKYLAIGGYNPSNIGVAYILSFNGTSLTPITSRTYASAYIFSLSWSPDGNHLAAGGAEANYADGSILAGDEVRIYSFNGSELSPVIGRYYGSAVWCIAWHPDGKTIVVVGIGAANGGTNNPFEDTNLVRFYQFTGSALNGLMSYAPTGPAAGMTEIGSCSWDPTGAYLLLAGDNVSNTEYYGILQTHFTSLTTGAASNSLVYGNSTLGSSANLTINGSYAMLRGNLLNQNV